MGLTKGKKTTTLLIVMGVLLSFIIAIASTGGHGIQGHG